MPTFVPAGEARLQSTHPPRPGRPGIPRAAGAALLGLALGALGCEATFTPSRLVIGYEESGDLVPAPYVPPNIWAYPRASWGGGWAYLADGQWYYPTDDGWMVFRREPVELSRQRRRIAPRPYGPQPLGPPGYDGTYPR